MNDKKTKNVGDGSQEGLFCDSYKLYYIFS